MDRRLLQFLAVAETGNVTAAADVLNISQPSISVNIKRLEQDYGAPLFLRSSRGVVLTEFGKILYEHAQVMKRLNEHAASEIRALKVTNRPSLKVGCGFTWWDLFVKTALAHCTQHAPEALVHVDICSSFDGLRSLLAGDIFCFVGSEVDRTSPGMSFEFDPLFEVQDAFFARRGHPLAGRACKRADLLPFARLDVAPFVNSHFGITEREAPTTRLSNAMPAAQMSSNSMTSGMSLLRDTDAYLIYPEETAPYFETQGIVKLSVRDRPKRAVRIGLYRLAEKQPTPLQAEFLALLRELSTQRAAP